MRMTKGVDLWECENCGEAVIMGRRCPVCGANYADQLKAEHRKPAKPRQKKENLPKVIISKRKEKENDLQLLFRKS